MREMVRKSSTKSPTIGTVMLTTLKSLRGGYDFSGKGIKLSTHYCL